MKFAHFSHVWNKPGMTPHERYEQLWRELILCDELGIDFSFCVEHHFRPDESWMSSPSLYAVGAGARTKRLRVGSMGYIVPLYHPLRLAEEIALVDQMLAGGSNAGWCQASPRLTSSRSASNTLSANRRPSNSSIICAPPMARRSPSRSPAPTTRPRAPSSPCSRCKNRTRRCG